MSSRWSVLVGLGLAFAIGGVFVARARADSDESAGARAIRLKNVADEERRGTKPWVLTSTIEYTKTVETKGPSYYYRDTTTGHGESRREFFPEDDTDEQTSTDPNDSMWKSKTGTGAFDHTLTSKGVDSCSNLAVTTDITERGSVPCDAHLEWQPDPSNPKRPLFIASAGCNGEIVGDSKLVFAQRNGDTPGCHLATQTSKTKTAGRFALECTQDNGQLVHRDGGWYASCVVTHSTTTTEARGVTTTTERAAITVTLNGKELRYEATIEPVDAKAYATWRPTGPAPDGTDPTNKDGNAIAVKVVVRDAKTHAPVAKPYKTRVALLASKVPGILANYPAKKQASDQYDLYFKKADNGAATIGNDDQTLELPVGQGGAPITIRSRDWGAYGSVSASAEIEGHQIAAVYVTPKKQERVDAIPLPRDDNKNHIADAWEEQHGGARDDRSATEDDEAEPAMFNKGDGLSLYDEYRGFYLIALPKTKPERVELDPKKRELVIAVGGDAEDRKLSYAAAKTFADMQKLGVYAIDDRKYAAPMPGDLDADHPRRINAYSFDPQAAPQALVWIVFDVKAAHAAPGTTQSVDGIPPAAYASPNENQGVFISHEMTQSEIVNLIGGVADPELGPRSQYRYTSAQAYLKSKNITLAAFKAKAEGQIVALRQQLEQFEVLHELGHAIGAQHHEYKQVAACSRGCTEDAQCGGCPAFTATSRHAEACSVAARNGVPIPLSESEPLVAAHKFAGLTFSCYAGENEHLGGGDANCPMRYFHYLDGPALAQFLYGTWHPEATGPSGGWHMCSENAPQRRFHQGAGDLMKP